MNTLAVMCIAFTSTSPSCTPLARSTRSTSGVMFTKPRRPGRFMVRYSRVDFMVPRVRVRASARAAIERAGLKPADVDHVVMGNAMQTSGDAIYGARHVALKSGVPREVPALTVNRLCGSGLQSVVSAAQQIQTGEATVVLAGGMENMSQAPHVIRGARGGLRLGLGALEDSLMVALQDSWCGLAMAQTSDNLARRHGITREHHDAYALRSHTLGNQAAREG